MVQVVPAPRVSFKCRMFENRWSAKIRQISNPFGAKVGMKLTHYEDIDNFLYEQPSLQANVALCCVAHAGWEHLKAFSYEI